VRLERPETKTWHYVNIPVGGTYNAARDCAPPGCIVGKITELLKVITDKNAPREQRAEALKFLVHFVGDIHQPMHAAKEAAGGNGIHVKSTWFGGSAGSLEIRSLRLSVQVPSACPRARSAA
jgi:hypothetical protein